MKTKFLTIQVLLISLFLLVQLIFCNQSFACTFDAECESGYCDSTGQCASAIAPTTTPTCPCCDQYSSPPTTTDTTTYTKLRSTETQPTTTESLATRTLRARGAGACRNPPCFA